jgi:hypothetical protein
MVNPKVTNIAVPALNCGFVAITLTLSTTARAAIQEDPSNAGFGQGLVGYYVDPSIATTAVMASLAGQPAAAALAHLQKLGALKPNVQQTWLPTAGGAGQAYQPIQLGQGESEYVGAAGACVLLVTSATETATGILLTEWK